MHQFTSPGAGAAQIAFAPTFVGTDVWEGQSFGGLRRELYISLDYRVTSATSRNLFITVNPDDLTLNDNVIVPLGDGVSVDMVNLDGGVYFSDDAHGLRFVGQLPPSGRLIFHRGGTTDFSEVRVELEDVTVPAYCALGGCQGFYLIDGFIEDVVSPAPELSLANWPFGDLLPDEGLPIRDELTVAIERCSRLDTRYLATGIEQVGDLLALDSQRLAIITNAPNANDFTYLVPQRMLHSTQDLPININDVRLLKSAIDGASAAASLVAQYQYLAGDIQDQIETYDESFDDDSPFDGYDPYGPATTLPVRGFNPTQVVMHLEAGFLEREASFNLDVFRTRLDASLEAFASSLRGGATQPGLFDPQMFVSRRLANELATAAEVTRDSIYSAQPLALTNAPGTTVHLKAFFDAPYDRDRIKALTGLPSLWRVEPGDPQGAIAWRRNPRLVFTPSEDLEIAASQSATMSGGALSMPANMSTPYFAESSTWEDTVTGEWPVFFSTVIRDDFVHF